MEKGYIKIFKKLLKKYSLFIIYLLVNKKGELK
jgi:hypothetical protein